MYPNVRSSLMAHAQFVAEKAQEARHLVRADSLNWVGRFLEEVVVFCRHFLEDHVV